MRKHSDKSRMWDILQEKCLNSSKTKPISWKIKQKMGEYFRLKRTKENN